MTKTTITVALRQQRTRLGCARDALKREWFWLAAGLPAYLIGRDAVASAAGPAEGLWWIVHAWLAISFLVLPALLLAETMQEEWRLELERRQPRTASGKATGALLVGW